MTAARIQDFGYGVSGWRGSASQAALRDAVTRLEARHAVRGRQVIRHGQQVAEAAGSYTAADSGAEAGIESVAHLGTGSP